MRDLLQLILTDRPSRWYPSAMAEILVENIQNIADLPLLRASAS